MITSINGNMVFGTYIPFNNSLDFGDIYTVNNQRNYQVRAILPNCRGGSGGSDGQDGPGMDFSNGRSVPSNTAEHMLHLMPNPTSGQVVLAYHLPDDDSDKSFSVIVVNALGVLQHRFDLNADNMNGSLYYDTSTLHNGVYQVYLLESNRVLLAKRLIVMNR